MGADFRAPKGGYRSQKGPVFSPAKIRSICNRSNECKSIGTQWGAFYVINDRATYLDRFGVEHIPKMIIKFIDNKIIEAKLKNGGK